MAAEAAAMLCCFLYNIMLLRKCGAMEEPARAETPSLYSKREV